MVESPFTSPESTGNARTSAFQAQGSVLQEFLRDAMRDRTFDGLNAGLGEDTARAVIVSIGEAALRAAPELTAGELGSVVVQTVARLSPQDLIGIAKNESSALGRAQAIAQEEVKAQKNAQPAVNKHSAASVEGRSAGIFGYAGSAETLGRPSGRQYSDIRDTDVKDAASFAKEIGARPGDANLFTGASSAMRDAIRGFIKDGKAITDDDVRNLGDVQAVIGLVRSGKLKPDDPRIPPSVQQIIKEMKRDGIDPATADPKVIKKYFKDHPGALIEARKEARADINAKANYTDQQIGAEAVKLRDKAIKDAAAAQQNNKDAANTKTSPAGRDVKLAL